MCARLTEPSSSAERSALGSDVEDGGDAQMLRVVLLVEHSHQKHTQWCAEGNVKM